MTTKQVTTSENEVILRDIVNAINTTQNDRMRFEGYGEVGAGNNPTKKLITLIVSKFECEVFTFYDVDYKGTMIGLQVIQDGEVIRLVTMKGITEVFATIEDLMARLNSISQMYKHIAIKPDRERGVYKKYQRAAKVLNHESYNLGIANHIKRGRKPKTYRHTPCPKCIIFVEADLTKPAVSIYEDAYYTECTCHSGLSFDRITGIATGDYEGTQ